MKSNRFLTAMCALVVLSGCVASPEIQMGENARVNDEGLHFVDNTIMDEVWFRPDADLTGYTKIIIVAAETQFVDAENASANMQKKHERFNKIMLEEFTEALAELQNFEITDTAGPDVLLMNGAVLNVELVEETSGAFERVFARELGSADLVIDLRDSTTGQAIAVARDNRVLDGVPVGPRGELTEATDTAVWSAVRRQARSWATLVRSRLDTLATYRLNGESAAR